MNFQADARKFYEALSKLYALTQDSRVTNPPVLIIAKDSEITMHLQSPSVVANVTLEVEGGQGGEEVLVAKHLMPILAISEGEAEFIFTEGQMVIKGSSEIKVPLWDIKFAQSPVEVKVEKGYYIDMRPFALHEGITICEDWIASNDMACMNTAYRKLSEPIVGSEEFYLPPNVGELLDGSVGFEIRDKWLHAVGERFSFKCPGSSGYRSISKAGWDMAEEEIGKSVSYVTVGSKLATLVSAIGRVFGVKDLGGSAAIRLLLEDGRLLVQSPSSLFGEFNDSVPVLASGEEEFDVIVRSDQFARALGVLKGGDIMLTQTRSFIALTQGDLRLTNAVYSKEAYFDTSKEVLNARAQGMEQENEITF